MRIQARNTSARSLARWLFGVRTISSNHAPPACVQSPPIIVSSNYVPATLPHTGRLASQCAYNLLQSRSLGVRAISSNHCLLQLRTQEHVLGVQRKQRSLASMPLSREGWWGSYPCPAHALYSSHRQQEATATHDASRLRLLTPRGRSPAPLRAATREVPAPMEWRWLPCPEALRPSLDPALVARASSAWWPHHPSLGAPAPKLPARLPRPSDWRPEHPQPSA